MELEPIKIRKLQPLIKLELPKREGPKPWDLTNHQRERKRNLRRRADYPPPTVLPTPCVLWQGSVDKFGYGRRNIRKRDGRSGYKLQSLHRWIIEYVEERTLTSSEVVLHLCDNPPCYRYDHLRVGTVQENNADRDAKGRLVHVPQHMHGATNGRAKLTEAQVRKIRKDYVAGINVQRLAREYDVHRTTIQRIATGLRWASANDREDLFTKIAREKKEAARRAKRQQPDDQPAADPPGVGDRT